MIDSQLWALGQVDPAAGLRLSLERLRKAAGACQAYQLHLASVSQRAIEVANSLDRQRGDNTASMIAATLCVGKLPQDAADDSAIAGRLVENVRQLERESLVAREPWRLSLSPVPAWATILDGFDLRPVAEAISSIWRRACPALNYTAPHCQPGAIRTPGPTRVAILRSHDRPIREHFGGLNEAWRGRFEVRVFQDHFPNDLATPDYRETRDAIERFKPDVLLIANSGSSVGSWYWLAHPRLAPVQVALPAWPFTTGINTIDYFASSEFLETPESDVEYAEQLVRLPCLPTAMAYPGDVCRQSR